MALRAQMRALSERIEELSDRNWELKEIEERAKSFLEAQGDVIVRRDSGGFITFVNDAFLDLVGIPREEVIGKSVKEVLGHISDSERIFTYRALRIARGDLTPMEGFEQDDYVRSGGFNERPLASLAEEYAFVRGASLALFRSLGKEAWLRRGTANKNEVSVRALAYITAGHELHHRQILEERYFSAIPRA